MGKQFKSLAEAVSYVKSAHSKASVEIGRDVEKIMKETTQRNLYDNYSPEEYDRTYDLLNMIRATDVSSNSVTVAIEDTGGHTSWKKPNPHVYVAPYLEAGGYTWEKGGERKQPTRIIEDTLEESRDEVPNTYIRVMASKGIDVNRK